MGEVTEKRGWWDVTIKITLEGKSVHFKDLSESTQDHICEAVLDGYTEGEICETMDKE